MVLFSVVFVSVTFIGIVSAETFFITPNCAQINGVQFTVPATGTYRVSLTSGAYGVWPLGQDPSGQDHWRTLLYSYKNRAVAWCGPGELVPCNPDFSLGVAPMSTTYAAAEAAGKGDFFDVDLNAGDYIMMIAPDGQTGYCGNGCNDGVNVDVTATSQNQPPVASFEYSPLNPSIIDTIKFKSTSTDPDNDQLTYNWEFRDVSTSTLIYTSTLIEVDYKFTKVGRYNIKLTVKDPTNAPVFTDKTISVVCGGPNPISAAVVRGANLDNYGCRKIPFTSESGEIINICWPLDRFIMVYYGPICGNGIDVGRCEFVHGSNLETITYVDNNNNGKPDCFLSTNWRNRDYGEDDNGDGKLDWYVFDFNANTCTLSTTHRLFEYPYPCGGNLPACVVWDQDTWKLACNQKSTKSLPICNRQYIYKKPEGPVIL